MAVIYAVHLTAKDVQASVEECMCAESRAVMGTTRQGSIISSKMPRRRQSVSEGRCSTQSEKIWVLYLFCGQQREADIKHFARVQRNALNFELFIREVH